MGKINLGDKELTQQSNVIALSGTTTAHTTNTEIHVTQVLLDRISTLEEKIQKAQARETSEYEIVGEPTIPTEIDGDAISFDITVNYKRTDTHADWSETVSEGTDTVTVECGTNPSTASSRTVSGTVDYHSNDIEYSVTQSKYVAKVVAKFNVTDTNNPTRIGFTLNAFKSIEVDGVEQSVNTGYTFSTTGEHTVKYTLHSVTSIGNDATFYKCSNLTSIVIPNGVTSINQETFRDCTSLTSIVIPDSVTSINKWGFLSCSSLASCTIGSSVTSIGAGVFMDCSSLTSIDIPDSVISLGGSAFDRCSSLTSVTIGSGVTSIDSSTFRDCNNLTRLNSDTNGVFNIPSGVTSIGGSAFNGCVSLTSIYIPNGVTSIGRSTFGNCTSLTSIGSVGSGASVEIPDSVTSIGEGAFSGCSNLTSCTIGSGVTTIGDYAFYNCSSLTSVTIDSGVTSIGDYVFQYCSSLTSIISNAVTAPTIISSTFRNAGTGGTLTVPIGSSGYDVWMGTSNYYLGKYNWTKVEQ